MPQRTLLLAPGASAGLASPFMRALIEALRQEAVNVVPFEFSYMMARHTTGRQSPPPPVAKAVEEYREKLDKLNRGKGALFVGGKSYGGRVASHLLSPLAGDPIAGQKIAGLVCFGYPFHPPGKPDTLRTAHLATLTHPALIMQGSRDPFGTRNEAATFALSPAIKLHWLADGDHDFKPRVASGYTQAAHIAEAARVAAAFMLSIVDGRG